MRLTLVCLALALPVTLAAGGEEPAPLSVYFTAVERKALLPEERKARGPELKARLDQESKAINALRKRYGKKLETWPEAERADYRRKLEACLQLESEIGWLELGERDIPDSLKNLQDAARGTGLALRKKVIREVASPAEAHLVVEVLGRREADYGGKSYLVAFKATLGGQVDPARRDAEYWTKAEWNVRTLHNFTHAEPFWVVEALGITRWYNAANEAAKAVERFIKGNHDALAGRGPL